MRRFSFSRYLREREKERNSGENVLLEIFVSSHVARIRISDRAPGAKQRVYFCFVDRLVGDE